MSFYPTSRGTLAGWVSVAQRASDPDLREAACRNGETVKLDIQQLGDVWLRVGQ
jgi:hypothetical protein